mmetsp:Transcript_58261/g.123673  ORF Transcript_58261/g.123673 Transcript_58261/m.123673 type:complete len:566 (+) Transcript_58261:94-1791(+)
MGQSTSVLSSCCDGCVVMPVASRFSDHLAEQMDHTTVVGFSDNSLHELSRQRLRTLLQGLTCEDLARRMSHAETPRGQSKDEASASKESPVPSPRQARCRQSLLQAWWRRAQERIGNVDVEDLRAMQIAISRFQETQPLAERGTIDLKSFLDFINEETSATCISERSRQLGCLRLAVAQDIIHFHKALQENFDLSLLNGGGASVESVLEVLKWLFDRYGDFGLQPMEIVEDLLSLHGAVQDDGQLDLGGVLLHVLGRKATPVELLLYDVSQGSIKVVSPLLFGQHFEAIYHSSVLAYGKEFWYGGHIFENEPPIDKQIFGPPLRGSLEHLERSAYRPELRVVKLGHTLANAHEIQNYIDNTLRETFRPDNYDICKRNCNSFSNQLAVFLTGREIPGAVRNLPDRILSTPAARCLRPFLNAWLSNNGPLRVPQATQHENIEIEQDSTRSSNFVSQTGGLDTEPRKCIHSTAPVKVSLVATSGMKSSVLLSRNRSPNGTRPRGKRTAVKVDADGHMIQAKSGVTLDSAEQVRRKDLRRPAIKQLATGQFVGAKLSGAPLPPSVLVFA